MPLQIVYDNILIYAVFFFWGKGETMKWTLSACLFAMICGGAHARDFKMRVGQDTYVFDYGFYGKTINVYESREDEPNSDSTESIAHDWFALEDILSAIPNALSGIQSKTPLAIGRTGDIGANAFAAIHDGKRYLVISGAIHSNYPMMALVMGHELGHHVCGHTAGLLSDNLWARELEADTFSGMAVRSGSFGLNIKDALEYASQLFSPNGSPTHPPAAQRLSAIIEGYRNGSPCVGRIVGPIASNELGGSLTTATEPLWNHNGSVMRLIANGAERQFLYEMPRDGLSSVGITKGTLLFKGTKSGNAYSGTAYVFSKCGASSYQVSGPVSDDQRQVTLFGRAPAVDSNCRIANYRDDTLVFSFQGD
jgi:hypothetical protein